MLQVVQEAEELFGQIHGVIHAAGILNTSTLQLVKEISISASKEQFKPKIDGTLVLDKIFEGENIDFKILMSSVSSILGGLGHVAYASANKFMDSYAYYNVADKDQDWLSISWDIWENSAGSKSSMIDYAIRYEEGMKAFDYMLRNESLPQIVISTGDLQERINAWLSFEKQTNDQQEEKADDQKGEKGISISEWKDLENELARIFKEMIGVEKISKNDNFFEMGATSLTLIQINERIKRDLKLSISIEKFFTYSTIFQLINYLKEDSSYGESFLDTEKQKAVISESKDIAVIGMAGRFPGA
ncbi:KR domain-containing protein, partial [Croceitalea marina]